MKKYSWLLLSFIFATSATIAVDHEKEPDPAGGSIFFQTDDPAAYLALLQSDDKLFNASGAAQRGVCFNSTGMTESGRG